MPCYIIVILIEVVPHRQIQVLLLNRMGNGNIAVDYWCSKMQQKPLLHFHRKFIYVKFVKSWIKIYRYAQSTVKTSFLSFAFIPSYYIWLWRVLNIILPIDLYIHLNNAENILRHIKKLWYFCEVWNILNANICIMYFYWQKTCGLSTRWTCYCMCVSR